MALFLTLAPLFSVPAAFAQTEQPQTLSDQLPVDPGVGNLSPGAQGTQSTVPDQRYVDATGQVPLVYTAATNNTNGVVQNVTNTLLGTGELGYINETYMGMKRFWSDDIIGNLFQNIGQLIGKWISEWINGWVADTVRFLTAFLRTFVLNPNIAVNGIQNGPGAGQTDDISPYVRAAADVMYGIAVDLLLLLFILCIWKYWADAAWRGGAGLMGAVGRLIFTAGLLLAWPTIYAFVIQISNEMIQAIYFNSADDILRLDAAMASAVKGGLLAGAGLLASAFAPIVGAAAGGAALGLVGEIVAFAGLVIYLIVGGILIAQLIYILVLKAIQTALLTAQYMFGPIFLVFFATPDTENVASGYVKSFIEVSLWTFVWVGLLKIMVIILFSDFNPWGKIIMAVGVLQLMIQVPSFLARAQISPMSDFVSAGLITGGLLKIGSTLANKGGDMMDRFAKYRGSLQDGGARGPQQTQSVKMNGLPHAAQDPAAAARIEAASRGELGDHDAKKNKNGANAAAQGQNMTPLSAADAEKKKKEEEAKKKAAANGTGMPEQAKAVTTADGTTAATPPKRAGDALKTGAGIAAASGLAGAVMAGVQASDAQKGKTNTANQTPEQAAAVQEQAAKDAMANMWGVDPKAATVEKPKTDKEKEDEAKAKGALGQGQTPKLNVSGDPTKKAGEEDKNKAQGLPTALPPVTGLGAKGAQGQGGEKVTALDAQGRPLTVKTTGDGTGNEKGSSNVEGEQETEKTQANVGVGRDVNVRLNEKANAVTPGKTGDPKLNVQDGKAADPKAQGQQPNTGAVPTNKLGAVPPAQGQNQNIKTQETLQTGPEQVTGQQEHEVLTMGQGVNGIPINVRVGQGINANRPGAPMSGQQVQIQPPLRPGSNAGSNISPITGAQAALGQNVASAATSGNPDVTTMSVPDALQDIAGPNRVDPFSAFDHSGYGGVAPNIMAKAIRTYDGVSMGKSPDGQATIVGSPRGVAHVRFGEGATSQQKAMQVATAGYAQTMTDDAEAFDAARQSAIDTGADQPRGIADRIAGNWMQYKGSSWKETYRAKRQFQQAMFSQAVQGSQAYVTGDEGSANAFTEHLQTRFGDMTPDKQAWMMHTLGDNTSPESGFGTARWPATDALVSANMSIDPYNRAAMARVLGTNIPVWQRPLAAKGIANYMKGVVDERCTPDTSTEERSALAGHLSGKLSPAIVDACATIQQHDPSPETALRNPSFVNAVAIRGARYAKEGNISNPMRQAYDEQLIAGSMGSGGGAYVQGTASYSNGGGGGGGGGYTDSYTQEVNVQPGAQGYNPGMGAAQIPGFNPGALGGDVVRQQVNANFRVAPTPPARGVNNQPLNISSSESQRVDTQVSGRVVNSTGSQVVNSEMEAVVQPTGMSALPPVVPMNAIPRSTQNLTNVVDVKIRHQQGNVAGQNVSMTVQGQTSGSADVRIGRVSEQGGGGNQTIETNATVDIISGGGGGVGGGQVESLVNGVAQSAAPSLPPGVDIFVEMQQSGFTDQQRRDPAIVSGAAQCYQQSGGDKSTMAAAALTARIMGSDSQNFSPQKVQVVQTMINAGFKPNQISSQEMHIAEMIIDHGGDTGGGSGGGYPTPQYVRMVADHPNFNHSAPVGSGISQNQMQQAQQQVLNQLAQMRYAQRTQQGGIDGYPRIAGMGGGQGGQGGRF